MQRSRSTVAATVVQRIVERAEQDGLSRESIRRGAGLPLLSADPCDQRVDFDRLLDLWAHLARTLDDPSFPIRVAQGAALEDLHVLGFAMSTAPSIRQTVDTVVRYGALLTDSGRWDMTPSSGRIHLRWYRSASLSLGHRLSNETAVAQCLGFLRRMLGRRLAPLEVTFRHSAPARRSAHAAFFDCPVRFDAEDNALSFGRDLLDEVPVGANAALWRYLCQQAEALCADRAPRSAGAAVLDRIGRGLTGDAGAPSLDQVARALGTTERTLRRRLQDEGTSFRQLVEAARRERVEDLLRRPSGSIAEAAFALGFSDTTAFSHACKRWFGRAPSAIRAALLAGPAGADSRAERG